MLYYMHLKLKKLMLVLTSNVSGYMIFIELYGVHVIYVIVWFLGMVNMDRVAHLASNVCEFRCMMHGLMFGWMSCTT
jgi:hypothetical protein